MPTFTTPGMVNEMRHFSDGALDETYTRIPIGVSGGDDAWGHQTTESGTPLTGLPCKLRFIETISRDERGVLVLRRPLLSVGRTDPLTVGDLVTDVRDGEGRLLLERAAVVRVEVMAVGVGTVSTAVELEGAEAIPLPGPGDALMPEEKRFSACPDCGRRVEVEYSEYLGEDVFYCHACWRRERRERDRLAGTITRTLPPLDTPSGHRLVNAFIRAHSDDALVRLLTATDDDVLALANVGVENLALLRTVVPAPGPAPVPHASTDPWSEHAAMLCLEVA